jgi:pimeloyl-ACP methyl ester carboxylesterase
LDDSFANNPKFHRGTANTIPFSCYDNDFEKQKMILEYQLSNSSDVMLGRLWASAEIFSRACLLRGNATGSFLGTAFVARDLMSIVDALGEDGMLRYWGKRFLSLLAPEVTFSNNISIGISYGTTLGATVAAMFPERVDKLILDGVQNPHEYYHADA